MNIFQTTSHQGESLAEFHARTYYNLCRDKVFVWNSKFEKDNFKDVTDVWSVQTALNYEKWLTSQGGD